jgi:hypothetical protein
MVTLTFWHLFGRRKPSGFPIFASLLVCNRFLDHLHLISNGFEYICKSVLPKEPNSSAMVYPKVGRSFQITPSLSLSSIGSCVLGSIRVTERSEKRSSISLCCCSGGVRAAASRKQQAVIQHNGCLSALLTRSCV